MNRELAKAVVGAFRERPTVVLRQCFETFHDQDWSRIGHWLHTSGLALYFLRCARELDVVDVMPPRILHELEECYVENRVRTDTLFGEFVKINIEFQRAKLCYANLKGFSLTPRACPDPSYRYQHDLDFLLSQRDAERCRQTVERLGYRLKREYDGSWEFVAGTPEVLSMRDLYRARTERSLEIHFVSGREDNGADLDGDRLSRLQLQVWHGFEFPALSESDKLLGQARHLFRHLQSEWTRAAWLLEFANAIRSHECDEFWDETVALINGMPERRIGIGLASLIACRAFGIELPATFVAATVERLPWRIRLWADCYQDELLYARHPGSKLYLLLQDVLVQECPELDTGTRRRLFPLHLPPRVAIAKQGSGISMRSRALWAQVLFVSERLRFHVMSGIQYKIESVRWKRRVAHLQG